VLLNERCQCCGPFGAFFLVIIVGIPILIFVLSAFFALPLWAIECEDDADLCEFYEWCASRE